MLDDAEFAAVWDAHVAALRRGKAARQTLDEDGLRELFRPVTDAYEAATGVREESVSAILHHRLSRYGPPCSACGKPLRTPQASYCAACGATRSSLD